MTSANDPVEAVQRPGDRASVAYLTASGRGATIGPEPPSQSGPPRGAAPPRTGPTSAPRPCGGVPGRRGRAPDPPLAGARPGCAVWAGPAPRPVQPNPLPPEGPSHAPARAVAPPRPRRPAPRRP